MFTSSEKHAGDALKVAASFHWLGHTPLIDTVVQFALHLADWESGSRIPPKNTFALKTHSKAQKRRRREQLIEAGCEDHCEASGETGCESGGGTDCESDCKAHDETDCDALTQSLTMRLAVRLTVRLTVVLNRCRRVTKVY